MTDREYTNVFVYGSLLRGESNHRVLGASRLIALGVTAPRYKLIDLGAFPAMLDHGRNAIRGEVYRCDAETLARLDRLEGHPSFYERRAVVLARGPCDSHAYFLVGQRSHASPIVSGDWRAHRTDRDDRDDPMGALHDLRRGRLTPRAVAVLMATTRKREPIDDE